MKRYVPSAQLLEVSLSGVKTVVRLERDACVVNGQITGKANEYALPPNPPSSVLMAVHGLSGMTVDPLAN